MSIGSVIAVLLSIWQEKFAKRLGLMPSTPEGRLSFTCVESALMPIGMFWFGWSSFRSVHWIVPAMAVCCITIGIFSIYLAVFNYLADVYHRYASSAQAAQSCCRNLVGGSFTLVTAALFQRLGYQGGSSLLAGIVCFFALRSYPLLFESVLTFSFKGLGTYHRPMDPYIFWAENSGEEQDC
jgi:hypothetical protein